MHVDEVDSDRAPPPLLLDQCTLISIFIFALSSDSILGIIQFFFKNYKARINISSAGILLYSIQPIHACQFGLDQLGKELIYLPDRLAFLFEGGPGRTGEMLDPQSIASAPFQPQGVRTSRI